MNTLVTEQKFYVTEDGACFEGYTDAAIHAFLLKIDAIENDEDLIVKDASGRIIPWVDLYTEFENISYIKIGSELARESINSLFSLHNKNYSFNRIGEYRHQIINNEWIEKSQEIKIWNFYK